MHQNESSKDLSLRAKLLEKKAVGEDCGDPNEINKRGLPYWHITGANGAFINSNSILGLELLELFQVVTFLKNVGLLLRELFWFEIRLKRHVKVSDRFIVFDFCSLFGLLLINDPTFRSADLLGTVNYIFDLSYRRGVLYHSLLV